MATRPASENSFPELLLSEVAAPAPAPTGLVRIYAKSDGLLYWKDDAGTERAVSVGDLAAHLADTGDAHDASAVSFSPTGTIAATDVQAAIAEVATEAGSGISDLDDLTDVNAPTPSDGDVLTWDATPGEWVAAAGGGGGGGDLTFISETVLGAAAAQIDITGIPTSYRDLVVVARVRSATVNTKVLRLLMGDATAIDTGNNYSFARRYDGSLASGNGQNTGVGYIEAGAIPGSGTTAGYFAACRWDIIDYASTARSRILIGHAYEDASDGTFLQSIGGNWRNVTAAVERLRILAADGSNFAAGSALAVYGRG
jgi:hypothetical protein